MANSVVAKSWTEDFKKNLFQISDKLITSWCEIVVKMGVADAVRLEWCRTFVEQVEGIYKDLMEDTLMEQNKLIGKIESLLRQCDDLCKDLRIKIPDFGCENLSLTDEYSILASKVKEYIEQVNKRKEKITLLNKHQEELCYILGREPIVIPESPLPPQELLNEVWDYIQILESDKVTKTETFLKIKASIIELSQTLGYEAKCEFEKIVLSKDSLLFVLSELNMEQLHQFHDKLQQLHNSVVTQIADLTMKMKSLWNMLDEVDNSFLDNHNDTSFQSLEAIKKEVNRLEQLKQSHLQKYFELARKEIAMLWDKCHYTLAQRSEFEYFKDDFYTEDLLSIHDSEIQKLQLHYTENRELYSLLLKQKEMWIELYELEKRVEAPDRLKNRGGQLLKEEKQRNALSKGIRVIEAQLIELAEQFEQKVGKPFTSWGKTIEEIIESDHKQFEAEKLLKSSARKRDKTPSAGKSVPSHYSNLIPPNVHTSAKKKLILSPHGLAKKTTTLSVYKAPNSVLPMVNEKIVKKPSRDSRERLRIKKKYSRLSKECTEMKNSDHNVISNDYDIFKEEISNKENCRSTLFGGDGFLKQSSITDLVLPTTPAKLHSPHRSPLAMHRRTSLTENKLLIHY